MNLYATNRNRERLRGLFALAFAMLALALPALAQLEKGVITGLVTDSSNSALAGARVSIYNIATDQSTDIATNGQGLFVSPPLTPGDYDLEVRAEGFKTSHQSIRLQVGQRVSANIALTVGDTAETVEVQDSAPQILETESSSISNLRTEEAVKDLPLNGRSFAGLVGLGAGVVPAHTQLTSVPYTQQRGDTSFAFNGLRFQENRILLDGVGDNENHNGLGVIIFPPIDAIQEFSEETADADARYGRGNGSNINLVFKSGTAQYHGGVFDFYRNDDLNARNYFYTQKAPLHQNDFGATFGGPLSFKRANPNTFFFVDYHGQRLTQSLEVGKVSVPDYKLATNANNVLGYDFSAYSATVKNPSTGIAYANNFIPASDPYIDATGANILNYYQANAPLTFATPTNNFLYLPVKTVTENAFDVKIDHRFSDKDSAFSRYSQSHSQLNLPGNLPNKLVGQNICGPASDPAYQSVLSETHVLSSKLINTARFGWSRLFVYSGAWNNGANLPAASNLNIPGVINVDPRSDGLPLYNFTGYQGIGDAGNSPTTIGTNNYQTNDNVNWILGKHSLDLGVEFVRLQYNMFQAAYEHGSETFGGGYSGLAWTDLLFGTPSNGAYSFPTGLVGLRQSDLAFYVQDNYKFNDRLTFNLGVRYENFLGWPWTEVNNKEYNFIPSGTVPTAALISLTRVGTQGAPRSGAFGRDLNFSPRVGLAYRLTNKTVFHGGYGIYYSAPNVLNSSGLSANDPVNDFWTFNNSTTYGANAANGASFVFAKNGFAHTQVTSPTNLPAGTPINAQDPNAKTPYSIQWHASIEQELPFQTALKIVYVGTRGAHLDDVRDINTNLNGNGTNVLGANRPYTSYNQINLVETQQVSHYDALQLTAERRAHNLHFLASYTYSHALDEGTGSPGSVVQPRNIRADYGDSDLNIPNRFVASAGYLLPFKAHGRLKYELEGWQVNTILNYSDGLPFSVTAGSVGDGITRRANVAAGSNNGVLPSNERTLSHWFNTAAFTTPATSGTWGNSGRNILQGPGTKNVDLSVIKDTNLTDSKVLQLRAEFFNFFNTPQFNNPSSTAGATAGIVSSAGAPAVFQRLERQIQLAAKVQF